MKDILPAMIIILGNLLVAYIISLFSFVIAVGWFCFAFGFQFGKWYGGVKTKDAMHKK